MAHVHGAIDLDIEAEAGTGAKDKDAVPPGKSVLVLDQIDAKQLTEVADAFRQRAAFDVPSQNSWHSVSRFSSFQHIDGAESLTQKARLAKDGLIHRLFEERGDSDMWTEEHRALHGQTGIGFPSNLRDSEWARLEPLIPAATPGGRPHKTDMRAAMNAILYLLRTGCPWRYLPREGVPPRSRVCNIFGKLQHDGAWEAIWAELHMALRERLGRGVSPTAAVLDSQTALNGGETRKDRIGKVVDCGAVTDRR